MSGLSFKRARTLFRKVENKLNGFGSPEWQTVEVCVDGAPEDIHTLWYRDLRKCADHLFGRPTLDGKMVFAPKILMEQDDQT